VNKSQKKESCDQGVKIREDVNSTSRLSLKDSMCVADISAEKRNNVVKKVGVIKAKDKEAINIVINYKDSKEVINNSEKVFSAFNNNKDKNYKKSNKDKDIISKNKEGLSVSEINNNNNKEELSKVNVNKSNNKDCTKADDNSRKASVIKSDKNISGRGSC
jgi:hypothetical protein